MLATLREVLDSMGRQSAGHGTTVSEQVLHRGRKQALVMVLNEGYLGLFFNWLCSCRVLGIDVSNLVLFIPSVELAATMKKLGLTVFHHKGLTLGFATKASQRYGDSQFMEAMWLKNLSVHMLLRLGWDVLFQDVDMVWQADPWPFIRELTDSSPDGGSNTGSGGSSGGYVYEALFQDDTQYQSRFDPLWVNSGFFFLRNTPRVRRLWRRQFWGYELMVYYSSQQMLLNKLLGEARAEYGLRVATLPPEYFPSVNHVNKMSALSRAGKADRSRYPGGIPVGALVVHTNWYSFPAKALNIRRHSLHFVDEGILKGDGHKLRVVWQNTLPECRSIDKVRKPPAGFNATHAGASAAGVSPVEELRAIRRDIGSRQQQAARARGAGGGSGGSSGTEAGGKTGQGWAAASKRLGLERGLGSATLFGEPIRGFDTPGASCFGSLHTQCVEDTEVWGRDTLSGLPRFRGRWNLLSTKAGVKPQDCHPLHIVTLDAGTDCLALMPVRGNPYSLHVPRYTYNATATAAAVQRFDGSSSSSGGGGGGNNRGSSGGMFLAPRRRAALQAEVAEEARASGSGSAAAYENGGGLTRLERLVRSKERLLRGVLDQKDELVAQVAAFMEPAGARAGKTTADKASKGKAGPYRYFFHNESRSQSDGTREGGRFDGGADGLRAREHALVKALAEVQVPGVALFLPELPTEMGGGQGQAKRQAKGKGDNWLDRHLRRAPGVGGALSRPQLERWWGAVAVWLVLEAGYHVLWQAANVVWVGDPWMWASGGKHDALYDRRKEGKEGNFGENQLMSRWIDGGRRDRASAPFDAGAQMFWIRRYQYRRTEHSGPDKGKRRYWETGLVFWRQLLATFEHSLDDGGVNPRAGAGADAGAPPAPLGHVEHLNGLLGFHQPTRMSVDILPEHIFVPEHIVAERADELARHVKGKGTDESKSKGKGGWEPSVLVYPAAAGFLDAHKELLRYVGNDGQCAKK
eukprot:g1468.t1